jgi:glycosyltransferase involved in cell wall biosynthesis
MPLKENIAIVYDGFPHYRGGIIEELGRSERFNYFFFSNKSYRDSTIPLYQFKQDQNFYCTKSFSIGPLFFQWGFFKRILGNNCKHCILLGNPYFLTFWIFTPILRLCGVKVLFWTHGWINKKESKLTTMYRSTFYRLANQLLVYGNRAKTLGESLGFPSDKITVINNCLNYEQQKTLYRSISHSTPSDLRSEFNLPLDYKIIICTARITKKCRFDLLINAAAQLKSTLQIHLLIIGDGEEQETLKSLAHKLSVSTTFYGPCYDELTLAKLYKASDLTVSPGKVGLTAIHSMAYGTPVLSHNDMDTQMPEVETIIDNVTGALFSKDSSESLSSAINQWFNQHPIKPEQLCIERIEAFYTPKFQRLAIESALI